MSKKGVLVVVFIIICIMIFVSCSDYGITEGKEYQSGKKQDISIIVHNEGSEKSFVVTKGSPAKVSSFTKYDHYLKGIYDEEIGGNKYFDSDGDSLAVWDENNPKEFYCQWEPIANLTKTFEVLHADEAEMFVRSITIKWKLEDEILNAVKGNLDKNLRIVLNFRAKEGQESVFSTNNQTYWITLKDSTNEDAESFGQKTVTDVPDSNYKSYSLEWNASVRCCYYAEAIIIEFNRGNTFNSGYLKDVELFAEFV